MLMVWHKKAQYALLSMGCDPGRHHLMIGAVLQKKSAMARSLLNRYARNNA